MKGIGTGGTRLLLLHPAAFPKQPNGGGAILAAPPRLWLLALISFFTFASLLTLFTSTTTTSDRPVGPTRSGSGSFSPEAYDALLEASLLHYAATSANVSGGMPEPDIRRVASLLRRRAPCNLLVFGLGHESLLWRAINRGGRTVFLDESEYRVSKFEERLAGAGVRLEAYDVMYTTKVGELHELISSARERRSGDCRAVQNLLFSDCKLAINDLPNHIYDIPWDVVLVDGPRGFSATSPGRMSAIFTAGVLARSNDGGGTLDNDGLVDVLVHDFDREAERVCSEEFLCAENLVESTGQLAHFQIPRRGPKSKDQFEFCIDRNASFPDASLSSSTSFTSSPSLPAPSR